MVSSESDPLPVRRPELLRMESKGAPRFLWGSAFLVACSSFLFGWHTSVLNECLLEGRIGALVEDLPLSTFQAELATGCTVLGALLGSMLTMVPEHFGKRRALLWNNIVSILGTALSCVASFYIILIGRVLCGISVGMAGVVSPVLLTEMSPTLTRGNVSAFHIMAIVCGIFASATFGWILIPNVRGGWRILLAIGTVPSILQLILKNYVLESPRWTLRKQKHNRAFQDLSRLRTPSFDKWSEFDGMVAELDAEASVAQPSFSELWLPENRRGVILGIVVMLFSAFTGINSVVYYSATIFNFAGVTNPFLPVFLVGIVNIVITLADLYLIDRVGRKALLLVGTGIMVMALVVLGVALLAMHEGSGTVAVLSVLTYIAGFAVGLGGVGFTIVGEIVPTRIRGRAYGVFMIINWTCNLVLSLTILSLIKGLGNWFGSSSSDPEKVGVAILYLFFGVMSLFCFIFILVFIEETKGKSLESISPVKTPHPASAKAKLLTTVRDALVTDTAALMSSTDGSSPEGRTSVDDSFDGLDTEEYAPPGPISTTGSASHSL